MSTIINGINMVFDSALIAIIPQNKSFVSC